MQQLNPSEISEIIKQRIQSLDVTAQARNEGTIVSVSDGIVRIYGLADVMYGEMIEFPGGVYGMALNLEQDSVGAVVLGSYLTLAEGMSAKCTGRILEVPVPARNCWAALSTHWVTRSMAKARSTPPLATPLKRLRRA